MVVQRSLRVTCIRQKLAFICLTSQGVSENLQISPGLAQNAFSTDDSEPPDDVSRVLYLVCTLNGTWSRVQNDRRGIKERVWRSQEADRHFCKSSTEVHITPRSCHETEHKLPVLFQASRKLLDRSQVLPSLYTTSNCYVSLASLLLVWLHVFLQTALGAARLQPDCLTSSPGLVSTSCCASARLASQGPRSCLASASLQPRQPSGKWPFPKEHSPLTATSGPANQVLCISSQPHSAFTSPGPCS